MKKKVGIYTWAISRNYGTCLQAYALQRYIDSLGYDAYIFQPFIRRGSAIVDLIRVLKKTFDKITYRYFGRRYVGLNSNYSRFFNDYDKLYMSLTPNAYKKFDVFLTGSDQLWNPQHLHRGASFLEFAGDKPKFAYATSIGVEVIPSSLCDEYKRNIRAFRCVGMREGTAVSAVKDLLAENETDVHIQKVVDPTFLLRKEEWITLSQSAKIQFDIPNEYVLCYLLGKRKEYIRQLQRLWEESGIKNLIIVQSAENKEFEVEGAICYRDAGPLEFVKLLLGASLVVTDSFHCTAISINNNISFWEFLRFDDCDNNSQNSRIYELLGEYGLKNRLIRPDGDVDILSSTCDLYWKVDYKQVNGLIEKYREPSEMFLKQILNRLTEEIALSDK